MNSSHRTGMKGLAWRLRDRLTQCNPKFNPAIIEMVLVSIQVK